MTDWEYRLWCEYNDEYIDDVTDHWVYRYDDDEEE